MAKVSIIIPCYNAQDYICKCLDSLLGQTFRDFEVILVNDCSKDNTIKVAEEWIRNHNLSVHLISNKKNSGPSLSRYYGAKFSQSEWVAFCDSDDWYESEFLEKMMTKAQQEQCELVFCGYRNVIGNKFDNHPLGVRPLVLSPKEALYMNVDSLCMTIVKRTIYINTPQPDIRNGEDMALVPLLIQGATQVGVLNDVLYNYYIRPGSASLSPSEKMIDSLVKSFEHINVNLSDKFQSEKEYLGIRNLLYGCLLNLFKYSYNTKKASKIIEDFEKDYPLWAKNKKISDLPIFKRVYVWSCKYRLYWIMWILSMVHSIMLKKA